MGASASRSAEAGRILLAVSWSLTLRPGSRPFGKLAPLNGRLALKTPPLRRAYTILAEPKKAKRFCFAEAKREAERRFKITNPWPGACPFVFILLPNLLPLSTWKPPARGKGFAVLLACIFLI